MRVKSWSVLGSVENFPPLPVWATLGQASGMRTCTILQRSMRSSKPIRILVVDDHFMVRMGLSASLNVEPDMEGVAEAGNGKTALEAYRKHRPSLVMMDLRLPGMTGTECTTAILHEFPDACILML